MVCIDIFLTNLRIFLSWRTFSHFLTFFSEKAQHNFIKTRGGGSTAVYKTYKKTDVFFRKTSLTYIFALPLVGNGYDVVCANDYYFQYGLPCSLLGLILTLVATFSNQCNCCKTSCCSSCFSEPFELFEFAALVTSSLHTPYILGPDGQLVREGENEEEEVVELEMEESKDSSDHIPTSPSTPNTVMSETEVENEMEADKVNSKEVHVLET